MVKLKRPCLSSFARGALGESLIFQTTRGRATAKRFRKPRQPKTPAQLATRAYIGWLSQAWASLTTPEKLTWEDPANANNTSCYHAFLKYNANRFKVTPGEFWDPPDYPVYPTASYPAEQTTDPSGFADYSFSNTRTNVWLKIKHQPLNDNWCTMIHYIPTGGTHATYNTIVHAQVATTAGWHTYNLPDAYPDTWRLWALWVSRTGKPKIDRYAYWTFPT